MQVSNMKNSSSIRTNVNDTTTGSERKADDLEESKTDFLNDTSDNFFDDSDFDKRSQGSSSSQSLVSFDNYSEEDDEEVAGRFISRKRR